MAVTEKIRVKDWEKFQHYKNRRPPWIKLYRDLLDDPDWHELDGETAKFVVMCWLIASENEQGYLPAINKLAFRLRIDSKKCKSLIDKAEHWVASTMLAECLQDATPEGEREGERETENICVNADAPTRANGHDFERFWSQWPVKRNKAKAKKAFQAKKFSVEDVDELIADVEARKQKDGQWKRGFIPHASTYLNGNRWEDDYGN